ncbi:MAG: aminoacyl-tRNA hydrolase, partial [bacterium]
LIKPLTYVNESGMAVSDAVGMFEVSLENLLVVCDDCELPFGKIRLRRKGQHGGHRGLESIIYHLKTEEFPRLRLGIEKPPDVDLAEYVLGEFEPAEKEKLPVVLEEAGRAAMLFLEYGVEKAMSLVNRKAENG